VVTLAELGVRLTAMTGAGVGVGVGVAMGVGVAVGLGVGVAVGVGVGVAVGVGIGAVTVRVLDADLVVSATLVATTWKVPAVAGAV
jgi:hypothetical protein